ncbi:MAG TPA: ABC transporter permease subunit [Steroidobacteraceae bacterium]|nr:ABC transporter permease subunit [Steroidobacteraceae bacterium]
MTRFFFTRLAGAIPTLFIIITITFFLMRAAPGGPFDQEQSVSPQVRANLESAYGFDQPVYVQYGRYLKSLLRGDFGPSFKYKDFTVTELIGQGFPVTLQLGAIAMTMALLIGIPLGTFAALRHNTPADYLTMSLAVAGIAIPSFVVLPFLGLLLGVYLHWLPVSGWEPGSIRHLALPVVALCLPPLAYIARLTRGSMLEVLRSHYIRTAFAKGLPLRTVIWRHALRPALTPVASYLVPAVASIMTASLVVETIAGIPGIGRYLVQGAINRDYTLVLGMVIIYSALLIGLGILVDLLYAWLDPRVRQPS